MKNEDLEIPEKFKEILEEISSLRRKAEKWDSLEKEVSEFFCNTEGKYDESNPERVGDLCDIGEVTCAAFEWL